MKSRTYFTICSNNYLAQATVLGKSVMQHDPSSSFLIVLADRKSEVIDYRDIPFEVLPTTSFEPLSDELSIKYDIIEFNTCIKPRVIEYLFTERGAEQAIYLDPDIRVYAPLAEVDEALKTANVALTPHAYTPITPDGKGPTDNLFLRFGVYNLGFIALKRNDETLRLVRWWKDRTFTSGFSRPADGQFVDQLYINLAPIFFEGVSLLRHEGYNVAPWNFHERTLSVDDGIYRVNGDKPLVFFHFSSFRIDSGELPVHHYNRYAMRDRPDLVELHAKYNDELKAAGYLRYARIRWAYAPPERERSALLDAKRKAGALIRNGLIWGVRRLPVPITERAFQILRDAKK
jgi:hypothetical protein